MSAAEAMIRATAIEKRFSDSAGVGSFLRRKRGNPVSVLRGVSIDVHRGDFVALLGANGVGKTTLMKLIATLLLPDAGSISVLGHDAAREQRAVRANVGYVMADERSFHWRLDARQNLEFFGRLDGIPRSDRVARISYLLERLDLASAGPRPFGQFSTGMKQRLAVARALLKRPPVLLMDEPTRSIDPAHAAEVWRLVRDEVSQVSGCVVMVTHHIQEALSLCSRVAILAEGRVVLDTSAGAMERYASDLDGFTVSVRGLTTAGIPRLRLISGIRDVCVVSQTGGEQTLEVRTSSGDAPMAAFLAEVTGLGASVCAVNRATPLQSVVERLLFSVNAGVVA